MNNLVDDLNIVAECSCKDHQKLLPQDKHLMVDGVMDDNKNRERTLYQITNPRHTQAAFKVKYIANTEESASSLDDSSNVTIYENLHSPIRISRSLTPELRNQVSTPMPGNQFYPLPSTMKLIRARK